MPRFKRRRLSTEREEVVTTSAENADRKSRVADISNSPQLHRTKSLFVHSLPESATSESLTAFFSQTHPLKHATIVVDPNTKISKGYGFVTFADYEDAEIARQTFDGAIFDGRKIKVKIAEPRRRDPIQGGKLHEKRIHNRTPVSEPEYHSTPFVPKDLHQSKLIVRNLPWSIGEPDQLAALFSSHGKVKFTTIPKMKPGYSAGFGFVVMQKRNMAEKAIKSLNGKEVGGRILAVDWAVEKGIWETLRKDEEVNKPEPQSTQEATASNSTTSAPSWGITDISNRSREVTNDADATIVRSKGSQSQPESVKDHDSSPNTRDFSSSTLFVRNIPFDLTDEMLRDHFEFFGSIRYARVVLDTVTQCSRGVGFVCFYFQKDANECLRNAPRASSGQRQERVNSNTAHHLAKKSLLEDFNTDPSGYYTTQGRVLCVSRAVDKIVADRFTVAGKSLRASRDKDKRRLYLLSEGTISAGSLLYGQLAVKETKLREDSAKQRQTLIKRNPLLHMSLTRLSIRNLPRSITSKDLKALARQAVVEFATDVKAGIRKPLSKEELSRGGNEQKEAERARKAKGTGIVKQAKVIFGVREGRKVAEDSGAGQSSGYGFIEYTSHRWALMGLRWLNGHAARDLQGVSKEEIREKKSSLIVEFAIENAQIVGKRHERENNARERYKAPSKKREEGEVQSISKKKQVKNQKKAKRGIAGKRDFTKVTSA